MSSDLMFVLSAMLATVLAATLVRRYARDSAEAFWILLASISAELGVIATVLSVFDSLTPSAWIVAQVTAVGVTTLIAWRIPRRSTETDVTVVAATAARRWQAQGSILAALALLACVALTIASGVIQSFTPIWFGDEKMYHASRVLYWIQHRSIFPYETHNDRQVVFTFGSELYFLWPILLTKTEAVGRAVFWLGVPSAAIGMYLVLRELGVSSTAGLAGTLVFLATPIVVRSATQLTPEMWSAAFLLGLAFWLIRTCRAPDSVRNYFFVCVFLCFSINVRATVLALTPVVVLVLLALSSQLRFIVRARVIIVAVALAAAASGLMVQFAFNAVRYGHVLGPQPLRELLSADLSAQQLKTHAVRLPLLLFELPAFPDSVLRHRINITGEQILAATGAGGLLPMETHEGWPGTFRFELPPRARNYSLAGVLWIPSLIATAWFVLSDVRRSWPRLSLRPISALWLLALPLLAAIAFGVRWMADSTVPDRFLIGPYALGVCIATAVFAMAARRYRILVPLTLAAIVYATYWPLQAAVAAADAAATLPVTAAQIDAPFFEPLRLIEGPARILFVGNQNAPDYPLFAPRSAYRNVVISWGKRPFEALRIQGLLEAERVTHVLLQNDQAISLHWDPPVPLSDMVSWLGQQPTLREVPLRTQGMRLYVRTASVRSRNFQ